MLNSSQVCPWHHPNAKGMPRTPVITGGGGGCFMWKCRNEGPVSLPRGVRKRRAERMNERVYSHLFYVVCRLILFFLVLYLGEEACVFVTLLAVICFFSLCLVHGLNEMLSSAICTQACLLVAFKARGHDKDVAKFLKFSSKPKTIYIPTDIPLPL